MNIKPLIPGHVLVCPHAPHRRLTDLTPDETADLFATVQLTQRLLARAYFPSSSSSSSSAADDAEGVVAVVPAGPEAGSFSVAVQDGPASGQTVPHVHVHVIPRQDGDFDPPDMVYVKMAGEEGNVGGALWDRDRDQEKEKGRPTPGGGLPQVDDEARRPRTEEEMLGEVERYRVLLKEMGVE